MNTSETTAPLLYNGTYTLKNTATGDYRTFKISTQKEDSKFAPGSRVIGVLAGPDNTSDYQSFGFVTEVGIQVWKTKTVRGGCSPFREFGEYSSYEWFAQMLWEAVVTDSTQMAGYEVLLEKKCLICNRSLTTPESIELGIGPVCAAKE
jgi:hypothetical protein